MIKKKILFVDDEQNLLSSLKRMLRCMRDNFDFYFSESAKEGLVLMEENNIDVVISDMRMPGMDGADFLLEVQRKHPSTVRIMLTGQADEESVYKTVNVVHQFLAKPCDPEKLKNVIIRAGELHNLINNDSLKSMITRIEKLPSIPSVYAELQAALKRPEVIADDVSCIIGKDLAMTAKLLQLLNSSFFGLFTKVDSPARAVKLLGLDTIKILVLGIQIFSEKKTNSTIFSIENLWEHSLLVAKCSKAIAMQCSNDNEVINNAYIAGMLHDIGRLLLVSEIPESYDKVLDQAEKKQTNLIEEEQAEYGASHSAIGAYLASLWGFSAEIIEAVGFHHDFNGYSSKDFSPALAVHAANFFFYENVPESLIGEPPTLDSHYIDSIGYSKNIEAWSIVCKEIISEAQ